MSFILERDIENLLAVETRTLILADGSSRAFSIICIHWRSVDYLAHVLHFPIARQLASAQRHAEFYRIDLDTALAYHATRYHRWYKDNDIAVPFEPGICPLFYKGSAKAEQ